MPDNSYNLSELCDLTYKMRGGDEFSEFSQCPQLRFYKSVREWKFCLIFFPLPSFMYAVFFLSLLLALASYTILPHPLTTTKKKEEAKGMF